MLEVDQVSGEILCKDNIEALRRLETIFARAAATNKYPNKGNTDTDTSKGATHNAKPGHTKNTNSITSGAHYTTKGEANNLH